MKEKGVCPNCGDKYEKKNTRQIYCKSSCKVTAWQKRNNVAKPDFLLPKKEKISGIDYVEVEKERLVTKKIDNPDYAGIYLSYSIAQQQVTRLESRRNDLLLSRQKFIVRHEEIIGVLGGAALGLATNNFYIGLAASLLGYFIADEIKKERQHKILEKVKDFDIALTAIERDITNAKNVALRHYLTLKNVPTKKSVTVKEKYTERLPKLEVNLPILEKIPLLANTTKETLISVGRQSGVIPLAELQQKQFVSLDFSDQWENIFGKPQENFKMMIYGVSGHGKSYFSVQLAEYLANGHGKILYNAAEEGLNKSLQNKVVGLNSKYFDISSFKDFSELKKAVKRGAYRFVVIDSVNEMDLKPSELKELWEMDKKRGIIYIMQVTKTGDFKGDNGFKHDADVIVKIENRVPIIEKNRYK